MASKIVKENFWELERIRCIKSPYYFFVNYCSVGGVKLKTHLSEVEFNNQITLIGKEKIGKFRR